jgi:hypothetical protein
VIEMIGSDACAFKKSGLIKTGTDKNCPKYCYKIDYLQVSNLSLLAVISLPSLLFPAALAGLFHGDIDE